jgi:hypothetical protein
MSPAMSRRKMLKTGLGAAAGVGAVGAGITIGDRCGLIPANHRGLYGLSETLTYAGQRLLTTLPSMAREFNRDQITEVPPVNGPAPKTEAYQRLKDTGFADWRLTVDGMVTRPASFSLADLKSFPPRTQITHQACEEGWSFIAEWMGVPLSSILENVGAHPDAKWAFFFTMQEGWWDSLDMDDAAPANGAGLRDERRGNTGRSRRATPSEGRAPTRLQKPEVPHQDHSRRSPGCLGQRVGLRRARCRVLVVRRDQNCRRHRAHEM